MSDDFNVRKFSELIKQHDRRLTQSLSAVEETRANNIRQGWTRRLSGTFVSFFRFQSLSQTRLAENTNRASQLILERCDDDEDVDETVFIKS